MRGSLLSHWLVKRLCIYGRAEVGDLLVLIPEPEVCESFFPFLLPFLFYNNNKFNNS